MLTCPLCKKTYPYSFPEIGTEIKIFHIEDNEHEIQYEDSYIRWERLLQLYLEQDQKNIEGKKYYEEAKECYLCLRKEADGLVCPFCKAFLCLKCDENHEFVLYNLMEDEE